MLLWIGNVSGWSWPWGVLFLSWTLPAFYSGRIHLIEEVERERRPRHFGAIASTWVVLGPALVVLDLAALFGWQLPGGWR
ncbi:MAG: hypothetical protein MI919_14865, partial [Holophagales bacterium]|nr:hypothetical protein [Holophagales bacterium]